MKKLKTKVATKKSNGIKPIVSKSLFLAWTPKRNEIVWSVTFPKNGRITCFRYSGLGGQKTMLKMGLIFKSKKDAETCQKQCLLTDWGLMQCLIQTAKNLIRNLKLKIK